jgi:uncharacterized protein (UPF0262 family)
MAAWDTKDIVVVCAAILSAAVSIMVSIINHVFSRRRYGPEKIRDLRREVYGKITFDLSRAVDWFGDALRDAAPENWRREVFTGFKAIKDATKTQRDNYLICSEGFSKVKSTLPSDWEYIETGRGPDEAAVEKDMEKVEAIRDRLIKLARQELTV